MSQQNDQNENVQFDLVKFQASLISVLDDIVRLADQKRKDSDGYKAMFQKAEGLDFRNLLRHLHSEMLSPVLDSSTVIQTITGKKITNDVYFILSSLLPLERLIENHISDSEGSSCCVDKTYFLLNEFILNLLKSDKD